MKVILYKDVPNLGEEGDICDVARGYARNFLVPRGLVVPYNRQNLAELEGRRAAIEQRREAKRASARTTREQIEANPMVITMSAGENGKLFGSVTSATIVDKLEQAGITVERRRVDIPEGTIKTTGNHTVRIKLYGDEEAELVVSVRPENEPKAKSGAKSTPEQAPKSEAAPAQSSAEEAPAEEVATEASAEPAVEEETAEETAEESEEEEDLEE